MTTTPLPYVLPSTAPTDVRRAYERFLETVPAGTDPREHMLHVYAESRAADMPKLINVGDPALIYRLLDVMDIPRKRPAMKGKGGQRGPRGPYKKTRDAARTHGPVRIVQPKQVPTNGSDSQLIAAIRQAIGAEEQPQPQLDVDALADAVVDRFLRRLTEMWVAEQRAKNAR